MKRKRTGVFLLWKANFFSLPRWRLSLRSFGRKKLPVRKERRDSLCPNEPSSELTPTLTRLAVLLFLLYIWARKHFAKKRIKRKCWYGILLLITYLLRQWDHLYIVRIIKCLVATKAVFISYHAKFTTIVLSWKILLFMCECENDSRGY